LFRVTLDFLCHALTTPATSTQPNLNTASAWSKESIVALATIFIMILFSGLGMFWKHGMRTWVVTRRSCSLGTAQEGIYQASDLAADVLN
jgi:hypothetical protein